MSTCHPFEHGILLLPDNRLDSKHPWRHCREMDNVKHNAENEGGADRAIFSKSFNRWASKSVYRKLIKKLSRAALKVAYTALVEMDTIKPGTYDTWWATHHNRFIRKVTQRELILIHECMYHYLTAFARGELNDN